MARTMIALYRDLRAAEAVVDDLERAGVDPRCIHVLTENANERYRELATWTDRRLEHNLVTAAWAGALTGGLIGAALGVFSAGTSSLALGALGAGLGLAIGAVSAFLWSRAQGPRALRVDTPLGPSCALVAVEVADRDARRTAEALKRHDPLDLDPHARALPRQGPVQRPDDVLDKDYEIEGLGLHDPL